LKTYVGNPGWHPRSRKARDLGHPAKVKIMLLAILPNWNSLDSVRRAHSDLELAGLVFFALLVMAEALAHNSKLEKRKHLFDSIGIWFFAIAILCEIAGYWYGQRNDALSEQKIRSLDVLAENAANNASTALGNSKEAETKSSKAADKAGKALTTSKASIKAAVEAQDRVDAVNEQSDELARKLWQTQYWMSGRTLVDRNSFIGTLRKFKGKEVIFASFVGAPEPWLLCNEFVTAAFNAEMKVIDRCAKDPPSAPVQTGVLVFGPDDQEIKEFAQIIAGALTTGGAGATPAKPGSTLTILVGSMSPFIMDKTQVFNPPPIRKQTKKQNKQP
jgi:hypothetical protein